MNNYEEIYPKIYVYHDVLNNPKEIIEVLKESEKNSTNSLFNGWQDWYLFGTICNSFKVIFDQNNKKILDLNGKPFEKEILSNQNLKELNVIEEIYTKFFEITKLYLEKYNITVKPDGEWLAIDPSIAKYHSGKGVSDKLAMNYHTDYQWEYENFPGRKFVITCTMYLNDNYDGGEISFIPGPNTNKIDYKPKAGDFIIFPSGNPKFLAEDGNNYLHGVKPVLNGDKYFVRTFWSYYESESDEWKEGVDKYGSEIWTQMQNEKSEEIRKNIQNRFDEQGYEVN